MSFTDKCPVNQDYLLEIMHILSMLYTVSITGRRGVMDMDSPSDRDVTGSIPYVGTFLRFHPWTPTPGSSHMTRTRERFN